MSMKNYDWSACADRYEMRVMGWILPITRPKDDEGEEYVLPFIGKMGARREPGTHKSWKDYSKARKAWGK